MHRNIQDTGQVGHGHVTSQRLCDYRTVFTCTRPAGLVTNDMVVAHVYVHTWYDAQYDAVTTDDISYLTTVPTTTSNTFMCQSLGAAE
jgi:hypothetical protein